MRQRPCVSLPKPPVASDDANAKLSLATFMVRYMLQSGNSEVPVMFLDQEDLGQTVTRAYEGKDAVEDDVTEIDVSDVGNDAVEAMSNLTVMAINKPTGCIVSFDNGNSLCVVGSNSSFYMIDLSNGIFCNTSGPEYDIRSYVDEFGSDHFKIQYFTIKTIDDKPAKKKKTRTEKKEDGKPTKKKRTAAE